MKTKNLIVRNFILVLGTVLIFSACSKSKKATDNLVGTWTSGTATFTTMVGTVTLAQYFTDVLHLSATDAQTYTAIVNSGIQQSLTGTIQIKSDNTYSSTLGGTNETGTWILNSDGTQITVTPSSGSPVVFDIVQLTSTVLKVTLTNHLSEDLNNDGTPESITVSVNLTFNK